MKRCPAETAVESIGSSFSSSSSKGNDQFTRQHVHGRRVFSLVLLVHERVRVEPHAGKNATPVSPKISKDDDELVVPLLLRGAFVLWFGLADDDFETDGRRQRRF